MIPPSGLYSGTLRHRRFRPAPHEFRYELFMAWLDIDRIGEVMARSRWTSLNRFNWASFYDADHFGDPSQPLRARVQASAEAHGVTLPDGPIFLLTHLRYLGYCFNPISLFYCYDTGGTVRTILAEVNNTFGERHLYWLGAHNSVPARPDRYTCLKRMHVSPFMPMALRYEFVLAPPAGTLVAHMITHDQAPEAASLFDATLTLRHQPWTSAHVVAALARHPWMTAKVIAGIHWQALRLLLKRVPVFTHPDRVARRAPEVQS